MFDTFPLRCQRCYVSCDPLSALKQRRHQPSSLHQSLSPRQFRQYRRSWRRQARSLAPSKRHSTLSQRGFSRNALSHLDVPACPHWIHSSAHLRSSAICFFSSFEVVPAGSTVPVYFLLPEVVPAGSTVPCLFSSS